MDRAYIDSVNNQAVCCWIGPNKEAVEELFKKAQVEPESIKEVNIYS
jgi:hypothetical protein